MKVDNAIIMAAGTSSRFAPLSFERPKALIEVKGEVLIERQIRQLQETGIEEIIVVTGYMAEKFEYLKEKFGVKLIYNPDYLTRNNNASIYAVRNLLKNSYVCSADNYFVRNPFEREVEDSYYAGVYAAGRTEEWCMEENDQGYISRVEVGGENTYYMLGHTFWAETFSYQFVEILNRIYKFEETKNLLWESIFVNNLDVLKMKIKKYEDNVIFEFDTLDELRNFDSSYKANTRSKTLECIARKIGCRQEDMTDIIALKDQDNAASGFAFVANGQKYKYYYQTKELRSMIQ